MKANKPKWPPETESNILPTHLFYPQGRLFYLFHALLFVIIIFPYIETSTEKLPPLLLTITNIAIIGSIIYAVSINNKQIIVGVTLGLPTLILCWIHIPATQQLALLLTTLLYVYAILLIVPFLVGAKKIGSEEIYGAISLYFLLGLTWATIYQELEWFYPHSLQLVTSQSGASELIWSDYLFFSFTTLTTLGYGDIVPINSNARSLAIIETTTGVIFLTVMVARVIGQSLTTGVCSLLTSKKYHK